MNKKVNRKLEAIVLIAVVFSACILFPTQATAQGCPSGALSLPKGNTLYLYFPTTSDSSFPSTDFDSDASPAEPFDVSDLDSGIGTTEQLRQTIFEMITEDYCEFNVEVIRTTTAPNPTEARWQIVAIGSDSETLFGWALFGEAQDVDIGDSDPQDYARVYSGSFKDEFGNANEALHGTDSTLERWATAIAGTTSHEAAHNYGAQHNDAKPRTGSAEDVVTNHVLATTSLGLTGEQRAGINRHFSDITYELLGYNLGLNIKTLHNWDFVNPNNKDAHALQMKILSVTSSLTMVWSYNGVWSPWSNPTVTSMGTTETFQGTTYNVFQLKFSTGKSWSGGANGVAPPAVRFHVGASFAEPEAVIVTETKLLDSAGSELPLSPRLFGYDVGAADLATGDFAVTFFNTDPGDRALILSDLVIRHVPRMIDINSMVGNLTPVGLKNSTINEVTSFRVEKEMEIRDQLSIRIASLTDKRNVDITYVSPEECEKSVKLSEGSFDIAVGELEYCPNGNALSLFPSTYIYVTATVVDPNAYYWDPSQGDFVTGPLESKIFYQFAGIKPDFNNNGIDDLLDIRHGTSSDENSNGVPDEAEVQPTPIECPEYPYSMLLILLLIVELVILFVLLLVFFIVLRRCR
ncbi:MAG: hypothetical protein KAJ44_01915 [Thermoplasmatales archaeon]|nr:hypothetical protein [Thermoplasmatales archaeon]